MKPSAWRQRHLAYGFYLVHHRRRRKQWVWTFLIRESITYVFNMSRQRGCPKRGRGAHIPVDQPLSSTAGSDNSKTHGKRSKSPSHSSKKARQQDSGHTSTGWGCIIEWFDRRGCSLGYAPKSFPGWTSSKSPPPSSSRSPSSHSHDAQSSGHPRRIHWKHPPLISRAQPMRRTFSASLRPYPHFSI